MNIRSRSRLVKHIDEGNKLLLSKALKNAGESLVLYAIDEKIASVKGNAVLLR